MKVLVIDCDESILEVLEIIISYVGCECLKSNYISEINEIAALKPDFVFIEDQLHQDRLGRFIVRDMKRSSVCESIKVFLMTTENSTEEIMKESCADGILAKPFGIIHLEQILS